MWNTTVEHTMSLTLDALQAQLERTDAHREYLVAEILALQLSGLNAPAYVNVPANPITDAQIDALAAQEGAQ